MHNNLKLVTIDSNYCNYLRKYDKKVPFNYSKKENRPFVGVLFKINEFEYFAPLSSPKPKHLKMKNTLDFIKIDGGKLGAVNFNNMLPVLKYNYKIIDFNDTFIDDNYKFLLINQLSWLNKYKIQFREKSLKLYDRYKNNKLSINIKNRCCNYILLEEQSMIYNNEVVIS